MGTCNVDCPQYVWDGKTEPDSTPSLKPGSQIITEDGRVFRVDSIKPRKVKRRRKPHSRVHHNKRLARGRTVGAITLTNESEVAE